MPKVLIDIIITKVEQFRSASRDNYPETYRYQQTIKRVEAGLSQMLSKNKVADKGAISPEPLTQKMSVQPPSHEQEEAPQVTTKATSSPGSPKPK